MSLPLDRESAVPELYRSAYGYTSTEESSLLTPEPYVLTTVVHPELGDINILQIDESLDRPTPEATPAPHRGIQAGECGGRWPAELLVKPESLSVSKFPAYLDPAQLLLFFPIDLLNSNEEVYTRIRKEFAKATIIGRLRWAFMHINPAEIESKIERCELSARRRGRLPVDGDELTDFASFLEENDPSSFYHLASAHNMMVAVYQWQLMNAGSTRARDELATVIGAMKGRTTEEILAKFRPGTSVCGMVNGLLAILALRCIERNGERAETALQHLLEPLPEVRHSPVSWRLEIGHFYSGEV